VQFLQYAKEIAYSHQEKWDGSGYPEGLSGDSIPISARLMAVADVYDALISRRVYKQPMPHDEAVKIMLEGKGQHFDPDMIDAFIQCQNQFKQIGEKYADSQADLLKKAQITG
jgi:putative two-component system response regulator